MTLTFDRITIDDEVADVEATPSLDDWLRLIYGVRFGASVPRRSAGPVHPTCAATAGWLTAMWGFGA